LESAPVKVDSLDDKEHEKLNDAVHKSECVADKDGDKDCAGENEKEPELVSELRVNECENENENDNVRESNEENEWVAECD
jgi:hypothetical protein